MAMTIGMNSASFKILSAISRIQQEQSTTMQRLATNHKINKGSDDPAGLIALNALNAELVSINTAIESNQRTQSLLDVADNTLTEVATLTSEIERMVLEARGSSVSTEEKMAYQAQIDQSIASIDRLINKAEFNGEKIFNGENRINAYTNSSPSIKDIRVYARDPNQSGNVSLSLNVTAAATYAYAASATAASSVTLSATTVLQITGKLGTATITLSAGLTSAQQRAAINAQKEVTGVSAIVGTGASKRLIFMSTTKGSDSFVAVSKINGAVKLDGTNTTKTSGNDAQVLVNGEKANAQGTKVFVNSNGISLSFNLAVDTAGTTRTITVAGGGATFQLGTDSTTRATIGMGYLNAQELGQYDLATNGGYLSTLKSGGANSLTATNSKAVEIARAASLQVSDMQARIGSFNKYQVGSTINALAAAQEGMTEAVNQIDSVDYAAETANLERQTALLNAAIAMLSTANSQQTYALALLQ
ncbi:MAG TPA: flagellin [Phycisphaerae bacterium]|nr:flagellin [Phycisphaerae bacterium]HRY67181.1 flagellin [Phycisphaerae bacterium]HSA26450.1 flagellin [Phycisphaerae bacterium]